jgi:hypothetical protein
LEKGLFLAKSGKNLEKRRPNAVLKADLDGFGGD